jgi:hypothetical protein
MDAHCRQRCIQLLMNQRHCYLKKSSTKDISSSNSNNNIHQNDIVMPCSEDNSSVLRQDARCCWKNLSNHHFSFFLMMDGCCSFPYNAASFALCQWIFVVGASASTNNGSTSVCIDVKSLCCIYRFAQNKNGTQQIDGVILQ